MSIFATSKGEFAERMTTFMAIQGRFEPQPYEPSLFRADGFVFVVQGFAVLHFCKLDFNVFRK
jgi:hypothetical protein